MAKRKAKKAVSKSRSVEDRTDAPIIQWEIDFGHLVPIPVGPVLSTAEAREWFANEFDNLIYIGSKTAYSEDPEIRDAGYMLTQAVASVARGFCEAISIETPIRFSVDRIMSTPIQDAQTLLRVLTTRELWNNDSVRGSLAKEFDRIARLASALVAEIEEKEAA